jgi:hypothetical protein
MDCSIYGCIKTVFSGGLCAKHYEEKRVAGLPPCKVEGCDKQSERAGMCSHHYRNQLRTVAPVCGVEGCDRPSDTKGLCQTHYTRLLHHGNLDADARAHDRGARNRHPLYETWKWHSRHSTLCQEWKDDFWLFVKTVGDRPSERHTLRRESHNLPIGPGNWFWNEKTPSKDKAEYARQWRSKNPDKTKNSDLKKQYGITLTDYNRMLREQSGVCAICHKPEKATKTDGKTLRDLAVDHDHNTGKVRALLCSKCNTSLGIIEEDPSLIDRIKAYLDHHK